MRKWKTLTVDFSLATMTLGSLWNNFQSIKEKCCESGILYKLPFDRWDSENYWPQALSLKKLLKDVFSKGHKLTLEEKGTVWEKIGKTS